MILLHGGLGHGGNWGYQVPALVDGGLRAVVVDSRGHGRSSRDRRPFSYQLMASDVLAIMDRLEIERAALAGWSDGACTALVLAAQAPSRAAGVLFFACNVDAGGTKPFAPSPILDRCLARHREDYARLSPAPGGFDELARDLGPMQRTQPGYTAEDLGRIGVPVTVVQGELDEFIRPEHAQYLARHLPGADLVMLPQVSHFAPLQRPGLFNQVLLTFGRRAAGGGSAPA